MIDGLLAEPAFAQELEGTMFRITGEVFAENPEQQMQEWWARMRPKTDLRWLAARLLDANCHGAAAEIARRSGDTELAEVATLADVLDQATSGERSPARVAEHVDTLAIVPEPSELLGLYLLDGVLDARTVAARLRRRIPVVRKIRALWEEFGDDILITSIWLLKVLTGRKVKILRARARFDSWWRGRESAEQKFDEALASGIEAADDAKWAEAAEAFARATEASPRRSSARYNLATCLAHLDRVPEASAILEKLTRDEPEDLEQAARRLEEAGAFDLAQRCQEEAFYRSLGSKDEEDDSDAEAVG